MGNIAQPKTGHLLDGYLDSQLHPAVVEALKRADEALTAYQHACKNINGQYLKQLSGVSAEALEQANVVRAKLGLPAEGAPEQPGADTPEKPAKTAKTK